MLYERERATPSHKNVSARKRISTTIVINYYGDLGNDTLVIDVPTAAATHLIISRGSRIN